MGLISSVYVDMAAEKIAEGNFDAAEALYKSALAESPGELAALVGFARVLARKPDGYASAEALLKRACSVHPTAVEPRIALADLYHAMGRAVQARAEHEAAERLDPSNPAVRAQMRRPDTAKRSLLGRLKELAGLSANSRSESRDGQPRRAVTPRPGTCQYCGNRRPPAARACGRCGATF